MAFVWALITFVWALNNLSISVSAMHIQLEARDVVIDFTSTNLVLSVQEAS